MSPAHNVCGRSKPVYKSIALSFPAAPARERIEFRWQIAEGYYSYRHRIAVQPVDGSFKFNPLELPAGEKKTDVSGPVALFVNRSTRPVAVSTRYRSE